MAVFYFHFYEVGERLPDEIGIELPTTEAAYLEAVAAARGMGSDLISQGVNPAHCAFEIVDEAGNILFKLDFAELMTAGTQMVLPESTLVSRMTTTLGETQQRVMEVKQEISFSLNQVRSSLQESRDLIARLGNFTR